MMNKMKSLVYNIETMMLYFYYYLKILNKHIFKKKLQEDDDDKAILIEYRRQINLLGTKKKPFKRHSCSLE